VKGFVDYMNRSKTVLHNNIFYAIGEKEGITVEVAMQWNDSYGESVQVFTNNIPQRDGGTHLTGLRSAMTRTINNYIEKEEIAKKAKVETTGDDMREGLTCVLSVKVPGAEVLLADQGPPGLLRGAAGGLGNRRAEAGRLSSWRNPPTRIICTKIVEAARAGSRAQGARELTRRKEFSTAAGCPASSLTARSATRAVRALPRRGRFGGGSAKQGATAATRRSFR
jgi:DNA gyrase subunit B